MFIRYRKAFSNPWNFFNETFQLLFRYAVVFSLFCMLTSAQQFPYQPQDSLDAKGVCTINGKVYYGIDCWCYSGGLGTALVSISIITLIIFFFISGCIWKGIFTCCDCLSNKDDGGFDSGMHSLRASMRKRSAPDTQI